MQEISDQIVVSESGVFIPKRIFGQKTQILKVLDQAGAFAPPQDEPSKSEIKRAEPIDCTRELQWLKEHRDEYVGQWVALAGDQLISHGANAREVADAARAAGVPVPFLTQVDRSEEFPFGGW